MSHLTQIVTWICDVTNVSLYLVLDLFKTNDCHFRWTKTTNRKSLKIWEGDAQKQCFNSVQQQLLFSGRMFWKNIIVSL